MIWAVPSINPLYKKASFAGLFVTCINKEQPFWEIELGVRVGKIYLTLR